MRPATSGSALRATQQKLFVLKQTSISRGSVPVMRESKLPVLCAGLKFSVSKYLEIDQPGADRAHPQQQEAAHPVQPGLGDAVCAVGSHGCETSGKAMFYLQNYNRGRVV